MEVQNVVISLLFIIFGWSAWIDINGVWVELPLLVYKLPEGWNLPAYFVVIIQLANVGPILYGILSKRCLKRRKNKSRMEAMAIILIISLAAAALIALAFMWAKTSFIGGVEHSAWLLALVFIISLVDCTSSVTYLPFMSSFTKNYMTALYIGQGLSGLIPTAIAFIQGAGEYQCANVSTNGSVHSVQPISSPLLFPVSDFFITLFIMMLMSLAAFIFLKYSAYCRLEHKDTKYIVAYSPTSAADNSGIDNDNGAFDTLGSVNPIIEDTKQSSRAVIKKFAPIFLVMAVISGLSNGVLPSIQTYSLLPYGHIFYSLGVKLSQLVNPLACFIGFCAVPRSKIFVAILTTLTCISASYILAVASYSPYPPVQGTIGGVVMICVWILFTGVASYLRVLLSSLMVEEGHTALFWLGVSTQVGAFTGAVITFVCVTILQLLKSAPAC